jgi:hypothetical protein
MSEVRQQADQEEPIGIVISRGTRDEAAPRFWAYLYSTAPESGSGKAEGKAA